MLTKIEQHLGCDHSPSDAITVYLIGVAVAGKTSLVEALSDHFHSHEPARSFAVVSEVTRGLVLREKVKPVDIELRTEVGMKLQRQILDEQKHRKDNATQVDQLIL